jgi:hypothetical protein
MKKALIAWAWSLGVVARSYWAVVLLAALVALWVFAAYEWLGLAESSALLLILALVWAIVQALVAVVMVGGTAAGAVETVSAAGRSFPFQWLWTKGRRTIGATLIFGLVSLVPAWLCSSIFDWINDHSVEVASFLTYHTQKPVSHILLEEIYTFIEWVLWVVLAGFLVSLFLAILRDGWRKALAQTGKLLAGCAVGMAFLTNLLSMLVFGGLAYKLANWHPLVSPGFWDYTQMIVRFSLSLILLAAGVLFASLALSRLQAPAQET